MSTRVATTVQQPTDKMDIGGRQSQSAKTANTAPNDSGAAKKTILNSIEEKYSADWDEDCLSADFGYIVFVSNSPETKKGMFPPIMTLIDYDIESVGSNTISPGRLSHITELDLSDNLLGEWSEVELLVRTFPNLEFLNLSGNLLCRPLLRHPDSICLKMRKLVLNGNRLDWATVNRLIAAMPLLEELHLGTNNLRNPGEANDEDTLCHDGIRQLFLSCNPIDSFEAVARNLRLPKLELLSVAECPVWSVPDLSSSEGESTSLGQVHHLNLSTTKISSWDEVDKLRRLPKLSELRLQHCPVLSEYSVHERRMMLISRLPNVKILNGGDVIPPNEREDAERGFIRFYNSDDESESKSSPPPPPPPPPQRYRELVEVHGQLNPLVNVNMRPDTHVRVSVAHGEVTREEVIKLYQTVQQFKATLHGWFGVPAQNMKLYYCDKDLVELAGPEEMKWPSKLLYTYNVRNGDKFIVDEKVPLARLRTTQRSTSGSYSPGGAPSPGRNNGGSCKHAMTFQIGPRIPGFNAPPTGMGKGAVVTPVVVPRDPETPGPRTPNPKTPQQQGQKSGTSPAAAAAKVSRNLFGKKGGKGGDPAAK